MLPARFTLLYAGGTGVLMPAQPLPCYLQFARLLSSAYCLNYKQARATAGALHCRYAVRWFNTGFAALAHAAFARPHALPLRNHLLNGSRAARLYPAPHGAVQPLLLWLVCCAPWLCLPVGTCCAGPRRAAPLYRVPSGLLPSQPTAKGLACCALQFCQRVTTHKQPRRISQKSGFAALAATLHRLACRVTI